MAQLPASSAANVPMVPPVSPLPPGVGSDFGEAHQQVNVVKLVHQLFRGRFVLVGVLAALGLVGGLVAGYVFKKPEYRSEARITISPIRPTVDRDDTVMPMFNSYVSRQMASIQDPRVLAMAMASPQWRGLGLGSGPAEMEMIQAGLGVRRTLPDSFEMLTVTFSHEDPTIAFTGLTQVLDAYRAVYVEDQDRRGLEARESILADRRRQIEQAIANNRDRLKALAEELGTGEAGALQEFLVNKQVELRTQLTAVESELIARGIALPEIPRGPQASDAAAAQQPASDATTQGNGEGDDAQTADAQPQPSEMSFEEIARVDDAMRGLLNSFRDMEGRLLALRQSGFGDRHRQVQVVRDNLAVLQTQMAQRREEWARAGGALAAPPAAAAAARAGTESSGGLLRQRALIVAELERTQREGSVLAGKIEDVQRLRSENLEHERRLQEIRRDVEELRANTEVRRQMGSISISPPQVPPATPDNGPRTKLMLALGFAGFWLPVALVGLWGLIDRRYRYSDEAASESQHAPLLGILPRLPSDLSDTEQASAAAHCVHQIRALLQLGRRRQGVYAVTSSNPGDGKTSLTLSLGFSFAASGSRTLLIDLDLIGQGLSRSLRLREPTSLYDALLSGGAAQRIVPTRIGNLWLLPTGVSDDHRAANRLSETMVHELIASVRDQYDVVLIDTGPMLGSIEAHLVCTQADAVVLVIGAGRARSQVKAAIDQLRRVGANIAGLVFNLAEARDFKTSAQSQSFRSVRPDGPAPRGPAPDEFPELEPLPRVMALDTKR